MMKVKVLKKYRVRETGKIVNPGDELEYPQERAEELSADGWVELLEKPVADQPEMPKQKVSGHPGRKKKQ